MVDTTRTSGSPAARDGSPPPSGDLLRGADHVINDRQAALEVSGILAGGWVSGRNYCGPGGPGGLQEVGKQGGPDETPPPCKWKH